MITATRRGILGRVLAAGMPLVGVACGTNAVSTSDTLKRSSVRQPYESKLRVRSDAQVVFFAPHLASASSVLAQMRNWINAMQGAYHYDSGDLAIVAVSNGLGNFITYDDGIWNLLHVGQAYGVTDRATKAPAERNVYLDDVRALQREGCVFLCCRNTLRSQAQEAALRIGMDVAQLTARMEQGLIEGAFLVPAGVGELTRLQRRGFTLVYVPREP